MTIPPIFRPFIAATKTAFAYLTVDHDFRLKAEGAIGPEAWVIYDSAATRITVHYELGAAPWVEIGRLAERKGQVAQSASIGLDLLLRDRGAPLNDELSVPGDIAEAELSAMISIRAERLRVMGEDLLRGDFSALPKLQTKAEKELERREAELFGDDK